MGCVAPGGGGGYALLILKVSASRGWVVNAAPRPLFTGNETQFILYRRLCGPQILSGRYGEKKLLSPTEVRTPGSFCP
jgi:hypothetical protein